MSVTIVTTPSKSAQATTPDSLLGSVTGSEGSTTGENFSSLFLAQLAPFAPLPQEALPVQTVPAETEADTLFEPTTDANAFLATLGINPVKRQVDSKPEQVTENPLSSIGKIDTKASNTSATSQSSAPLDAAKTELAMERILPVDDKAAKIAVSTTIQTGVADTTFLRGVTENTPSNLQALNTPSQANLNHITPNRETAVSVPTPVRDQNWSADFGQKILWLATNEKQTAQLTLNPPQMGPIEISLSVDKGNATASFVSANAEVRQAIESALPRLREMLVSSGIELGQANVGAESFRQSGGNGEESRGSSKGHSDNAILVSNSVGGAPARTFVTQQGNGLIDIFA